MAKKIAYSLCILVLVTLSALGGYFYGVQKYSNFVEAIHLIRENDSSNFFVHPIIALTTPAATQVNQFQPLVSKIKAVFAGDSAFVSRYSIYFQDLNKGLWAGINENDTYDPASMLKVALAFATYKQAENEPGFLDSQVVYSQALADINTSIPYADPTELKVNESYSINELLKDMIVDSDNGAKDALANTVRKSIQQDVYTDLGLQIPKDSSAYSISTKKYSLFFRRLYNGSYLNDDSSNALLKLLSQATFKDGLVAGVATSTVVSHKYGEHVNSNDNTITSTELHDCGVIYQTNSPYILCVMTEGKDESDLAGAIAAVSKTVNDEVVGGYK